MLAEIFAPPPGHRVRRGRELWLGEIAGNALRLYRYKKNESQLPRALANDLTGKSKARLRPEVMLLISHGMPWVGLKKGDPIYCTDPKTPAPARTELNGEIPQLKACGSKQFQSGYSAQGADSKPSRPNTNS